MLVIPAIDLKNGRCVRLRQGRMEDSTTYSDDPAAMALHWQNQGARKLHLVDLDGAFAGKPVNLEVIKSIVTTCGQIPIQIGGGLRSLQAIESYLQAGVSYAIIGTQAVKNPEFIRQATDAFPGQIIVGIDAKDGFVATEGWAEVSSMKAEELALDCADKGVIEIIYTDIAKDGMMEGVNLSATETLATSISIPVIASGGVSTLDDIRAVCGIAPSGVSGVITGRAIYEKTLDLGEAQTLADQLVSS